MKEIISLQCQVCNRLHDKNQGKYIRVDKVEIRGSPKYNTESVLFKDIIVCNNRCLESLVCLKGF